jgi:hypothetical protein
MRSYWKHGAFAGLSLALALGGGCACPGGRDFGPAAGLDGYGGLFHSTGLFQTAAWLLGGGDVLCCDSYSDRRVAGGNCGFRSEEICLETGRAVPSCWVCGDIFSARLEGFVAGSGLRPDGSDLTIDLASPANFGFAYFDEARGYTVVAVTTLRNQEVLQVILPGRLSGTHAIYGTDGKTLEPGAALRVENTMYSTQYGERVELGQFTIDGEYPKVGETLSATFEVKLVGDDGVMHALTGTVTVPFVERPEEIVQPTATAG